MDLFGTAGGLFTNFANMKFAEEMAGSQYQRAVKDMKAAGLNPNAVFGSGGGSPAAAPGGQMDNPAQGGGLINSASDLVNLNREVQGTEKIKASTETERASADIQRANAKIAESNADVIQRENSAYKKVLSDPGGELAAATKKYGGGGWVGKLAGDIGATTGMAMGNIFGGHGSAKQAYNAGDSPAKRMGAWLSTKGK